MAWKTNKNPLEYLEQRVKYYEKALKKAEKWEQDEYLRSKYTDEQFELGRKSIRIRLQQFKDACVVLAQNFEYE